MKRRDLAAGLALAGLGVAAEQPAQESIYIPKPHRVEDRKLLHDFMDEFAFIELVTASPEIRITHIPVFLDRSAGRYGTLYGHIARQNPQSASLDGRQPAVIVFRGPDSYISPSWSGKADGIPTWNFAVVHASGKLKAVTGKKALHDLLTRLILKFEAEWSPYDFKEVPESVTEPLMPRIFGFEMQIERLEGKFKLGQGGSEADRQSYLRSLRSAKQPRSFADFTAGFFATIR